MKYVNDCVHMIVFGVLYSKIIEHKGNKSLVCGVLPYDGVLFEFKIPVYQEAYFKQIICDSSSLWESVHAFLYLHVEIAFMNKFVEFIFSHEFRGDKILFDSCIFIPVHESVDMIFFHVQACKFPIGGG